MLRHLLLCSAVFAALVANALTITFPTENGDFTGIKQIYVIGGVSAAAKDPVTVNGVTAEVHKTGAWIAMVPVKPGKFKLVAKCGSDSAERVFTVRPQPPKKVLTPEEAAKLPPPKQHDPYEDLGLDRNSVWPQDPPYDKQPKDVLIMIDPGHGDANYGALSPRGFKEKDFNLAQSRSIAAALKKAGYRVIMTREYDSFPKLYDRPKLAIAKKVDLFISVHHNATAADQDPRQKRHTTTLWSNDKGRRLAECIQPHIAKVMAPVKNNGAMYQSLAVGRNPAIPSCLLEVDFINLPAGEAESMDPVRREKIAAAVVAGVKDWLTPPLVCLLDKELPAVTNDTKSVEQKAK